MERSIRILIFALAACVASHRVGAQTSVTLHAGRGSAQAAPWLYGATIGISSHGVGLRIGGEAGQGPVLTLPLERELHWAADADLVLSPTLWFGGDARRSVVPYGFAGTGMQPRVGTQSVENALPHWSWGGGLVIPVISSVSLIGEARSRTLFDPNAVGAITANRRSTEIRAGFALSFGGSPAHRATASAPGRKPSVATAGIASLPGSAVGTRVLPTAQRYVGIRYRYGGASPTAGFDCSGFVQYVFARHDVELPRTSRQQAGAGMLVEPRLSALQTGDLMFFAENGTRVSHVAIYAGGNRIIHSTSSGGGVRYDDLSSPRGKWFATRLVAARRITSGGAGIANLVRSLETGTLDAKGLQLDPPDKAPPPR